MTDDLKPLIEAALFVSGKSLTIEDLAKICNSGNIGVIRMSLGELQNHYTGRNSGIEIFESEGRYVMRIKKELEPSVMHLVPETDMPPAVIKTLALIAYRQPIKQSEIIAQRGNGAYKYIRKLKEAELIETHKSGRTKIITVTNKFKDYFQIKEMKEIVKDEMKPPAEDNSGEAPVENTEQ